MTGPNRPVYCTEEAIKVHLQNIKLPSGVSWETMAETASNEVDSTIGVRYVTPVIVSPLDPETRNAAYWLQNVSALIAAARFLLSASAPGSMDTANRYGQYLLRNAQSIMLDVVNGKVDLPGAEELAANGAVIQGATTINADRFSQVDMFYDNFMEDGIMPGYEASGRQWPR